MTAAMDGAPGRTGMQTLDPITREVLYSGLKAAVREMEGHVERTAMSPSFKDKKDYFVGISDASGRLVHALLGLSGAGLVAPVLDGFPTAGMRPGDLFFYNDPYGTAGAVQHLPDAVVVRPFFDDENRVLGFVTAYGHVEDVGGSQHGSLPADATDVFQEGTAYPPMRVGADDEVFDWFVRLLRRNSRAPELIAGDLGALVAACRLASERVAALVGRYGRQAFLDTVEWAIGMTADRVRRVLEERVPDGEYHATDRLDGVGPDGRPRQVVATLRKHGHELELDLSGTSPQAAGPINYIANLSGVQLLFARNLLVYDPLLETNEGILAGLTRLTTAPGTLVDPTFPAPIGFRSQTKSRLQNVLAALLAEATGGQMTAPMPVYVTCSFRFPGIPGERGHYSDTVGVGMGGRPFGDGPDVVYGIGQRNYPVEMVEPGHPLRVEEYSIAAGTGGAGRFRGGCGVRRRIRVFADCVLSPRMGNTEIRSVGLNGGRPGSLGSVTIERADGSVEAVPGIAAAIPLRAGDIVCLQTAGGGGWGDPLERAPQEVLRDVREGFVSAERAWEDYAVRIVRTDGGPAVDEAATAAGPRGARDAVGAPDGEGGSGGAAGTGGADGLVGQTKERSTNA
ncbi:hydantoinase B/oxoprolinase family protein [Streptosporangium sp. NPDC004631]